MANGYGLRGVGNLALPVPSGLFPWGPGPCKSALAVSTCPTTRVGTLVTDAGIGPLNADGSSAVRPVLSLYWLCPGVTARWSPADYVTESLGLSPYKRP